MDLESVFKIVVMAIIGGLGWFARQLWEAVNDLRDDVRNIEVDQAKNYVSKTDFSSAMKEIKQGLDKIYDKLDGKADK